MAATQFEIDSALMAGRAYFDTRTSTNRFPVPQGWAEFKHRALDSGFEAISFQRESNSNEIVISYAGTGPGLLPGTPGFVDWIANSDLASGLGSAQLYQAAEYYLEVKIANAITNPDGSKSYPTISFTGHSLGGGLAALMGVMFDERAVTFDQAPFALSANALVRSNLEIYLNAKGYSDSLLTTLVPEFMSYTDDGSRNANVTGYYVEGEALHLPPFSALNTIGTQPMLSQSGAGLDILGIDLHSQTLLTAFLLNDTFRDLSFKLPDLLKTLFDKALYARATEPRPNAERNYLDHLVRNQIGVAADPVAGLPAIAANAMLDRFVVDLQKLTPDTYGMASGTGISQALVVAAMEYRYFKNAASATQLFTFADSGLHFKYSDIGASSYKSLPKLVDAVNAYLTPEEKALLNGRLVKQDAWHIQSGTGGMIVHAGADNDTLFGGPLSDGLWGGAGSDILLGGANNDVLAGEAGNDFLLGGIGFDTYLINLGDGYDTVLDSDGVGVVKIGGVDTQGSTGVAAGKWLHTAGSDAWVDQQNSIAYTRSLVGGETRLLVKKGDVTVLIRGWSESELGIVLGADVSTSPAAATKTYTGGTSSDLMMNWDQAGAGWDGSRDYAIPGASNRYQGLGGSDFFNTDFVDDVIEGGDGNDYVLAQYGGADGLYGGDGNDYLHVGDPDPANDGGASTASRIPANNRSFVDGGDGNDTLTVARHYAPIAIALDGPAAGLAYSLANVAGDFETLWSAAYSGWQRAPATFHILPDTPAFTFTGWQRDGVALAQSTDGSLNLYATFQMSVPEFSAYFEPNGPTSGQLTRFAPTLIYNPSNDNDDTSGHTLFGGAGNDMVEGGLGNDFIDGGADDDALDGERGADTVLGGAGDDLILGGEGNDWMMGGTGADEIYGETGNDTYVFAKGDGVDRITDHDTAPGNADVVQFLDVTSAEVTALNRYGNDLTISYGIADELTVVSYFSMTERIEKIEFSDGETWGLGSVNVHVVNNILGTPVGDTLRGSYGSDRLDGGAGDDHLYGDSGPNPYPALGNNDVLIGGTGNDWLEGDDRYTVGDDVLDGGAGDDTLIGGEGNDTYLFGKGDGKDRIDEHLWYRSTPGEFNILRFKPGVASSEVVVTGRGPALVFSIAGTSDEVTIWYELEGNDFISVQQIRFDDDTTWDMAAVMASLFAGTSDADTVFGTLAGETINGQAGDDSLIGGGGDDTLIGGDGYDYLDGSAGNDILDGGAGNDRITSDAGSDTYLFGRGDGQDSITTSNYYGAIPHKLENGETNTLQYKAGVMPGDVLVTGGVYVGSIGLKIAGTSDQVDIVDFFNDSNPVQQVKFADSAIVWSASDLRAKYFAGTSDDDILSGTVNADTINGQAGRDRIEGGEGDDVIDGGADDDMLSGDRGNDIIRGGAGDDTLFGREGNDTLDGGAGNDFIYTGAVYDSAGNDTYLFGRGDGQDIIDADSSGVGVTRLNVLQFKPGVDPGAVVVTRLIDEMNGDVLVLSIAGSTDQVTVLGFFLNDDPTNLANPLQQIKFSDDTIWDLATIISKLPSSVPINRAPVLSAALPDQQAAQGGLLAYTVSSTAFTDPDASDTLTYSATLADGNALPSWLSFNTATRTFSGTPGNLGTTGVRVTATDTGNLSVSDSFDINVIVQDLSLNGTSGADALVGYAGNDLLDGGAGADSLTGGLGDDTYVVDDLGDVVSETSTLATEIDTVQSSIGYTLGSNVENLTLIGTAAITGSGNELGNVVRGNSGINTLNGLDGNDTLYAGDGDTAVGGNGDDTLVAENIGSWSYLWGEAGDDVMVGGAYSGFFAGGQGNDVITGGSVMNFIWGDDQIAGGGGGNDLITGGAGYDYVIAGDGNDIVYGAGAGDSLSGGAGNDQLYGEAGDDYLIGGAGNDLLDGGTGADSLTGGLGNDTYAMGRGYESDIVVENDTNVGNTDIAQFLTGVSAQQIWFRQVGNNLEASIIGTGDKMVVQDWYLGRGNHVEQFRTTDGAKTLLDSNVQNLVNAMASFAPPASGQTTLPTDYQSALAPVIAANWQ